MNDAPAFLKTRQDRVRAVLHLLQASSCFRDGAGVCVYPPCACAESLADLLHTPQLTQPSPTAATE